MLSYKIVVIGGGPAGMMAALRAGQILGPGVVLAEKNAGLGRKLGLTGKERCNITNTAPRQGFLESFGRGGEFLRDAFSRFSAADLTYFFERRGLKLKAERQGRVFPVTDSAQDVLRVLGKALTEAKVLVRLSAPVSSVACAGDAGFDVGLRGGEKITAQRVVIAAGGASYPQTGSTGDGFGLARGFKHKVEDLTAGLVPLETREEFCRQLRGLTLKNIRLCFEAGGKKIVSGVGELLFTHFGVSGPLILDLSSEVCRWLKTTSPVRLRVDLKPGLSAQELHKKTRKEFQEAGSLKLRTYLKSLLPQRFIDVFLGVSGLDPEKRLSQLTAQERLRLVEALKGFSLEIKAARPLREAMVTCGGVSLKEINPKTMESRLVSGLYFCGEVLNLAAKSGGFNLQAAFSTGWTAGEGAALSL